MPTLSPTWSNFPEFIKRDIVELLDFKSRCSLRICSFADMNLVDTCPIQLKCLLVTTTTICQPERIHICLKDPSNRKVINKTVSYSDAVNCFRQLFKNRKSLVDIIRIDSLKRNDNQLETFLEELLSETKTSTDIWKIRTKKLIWRCELERGIEGFMKNIDENTLKRISISGIKKDILIDGIANTMQWKGAESIVIGSACSIPIEHFFHVSKLNLRIESINPEDIWKLVQIFQSLNRPAGSDFFISFQKPLHPKEVLCSFNIAPKNEPVVAHQDQSSHTQRFKMINVANIFVVEIRSNSVFGAVCRVDSLVEDRLASFTSSQKIM